MTTTAEAAMPQHARPGVLRRRRFTANVPGGLAATKVAQDQAFLREIRRLGSGANTGE